MAKKKRAGATKRAGARRKSTSRKKTVKRRAGGASANQVDLKALRRQIAQSVEKLDKISATRGINVEVVRGRLERMMADLSDLCDENNAEGCFPTMLFPPPA